MKNFKDIFQATKGLSDLVKGTPEVIGVDMGFNRLSIHLYKHEDVKRIAEEHDLHVDIWEHSERFDYYGIRLDGVEVFALKGRS